MTGEAPQASIPAMVATAEWDTVITSSPIPISRALNAISIASVPFATPTEKFVPINSENFFSNNET